MAWAITYMVSGFETAYNIDCTTIESDVGAFFDQIKGWLGFGSSAAAAPKFTDYTQLKTKQKPAVRQESDTQLTDVVFESVYEVLTDFSILSGALEIYIESSSALENMAKGLFFQAGYFLGSGGFGFIWATADVWEKYIDVWNKYYGDGA